MNSESLKQLRIFFQDEDAPEMSMPIPLSGQDEFYSLGEEQPVSLPNGETLMVYAEVSLAEETPNVSLSIIEGERCVDVRCESGVVVGYQTAGNLYVLLQIGPSPCK